MKIPVCVLVWACVCVGVGVGGSFLWSVTVRNPVPIGKKKLNSYKGRVECLRFLQLVSKHLRQYLNSWSWNPTPFNCEPIIYTSHEPLSHSVALARRTLRSMFGGANEYDSAGCSVLDTRP